MVKISLGTKGVDVDWKDGGNPIKPPPKGLEPVGDSGWYHSPETVDPRDCQWYPDSPWCGGNPIDPSLQVGVEINIDNCGFTFTESGSALIKTPQFTQTYRLPGDCRREYEKPPDIVPPPPLPGNFDQPPDTPIPQGFGADEYVAVAIVEHGYGYERRWRVAEGAYAIYSYDLSWTASNVQCPSNYLFNGSPYYNYGASQAASSSVELAYQYSNNPDSLWTAAYGDVPTNGNNPSVIYAIDSRQGYAIDNSTNPPTQRQFKQAIHNPNNQGAEFYEGRFGDIFRTPTIPSYYYVSNREGTDDLGRRYQNQIIDIKVYSVAYCIRKKDNSKNPPLPLLDSRNCDCMQCCFAPPSSSQNNDDLLNKIYALLQQVDRNLGHAPIRISIFDQNENAQEAQSTTVSLGSVSEALPKIVERIEKVSKIIGIDALPLTVPETISDPINDNILEAVWDWLTPDATRKINNLFEWNVWMLEQFSSVVGHWQQEITVEDTDALKPGDQGVPAEGGTTKKKIVLTDISTTMKEQTMLLLQLYKTLGLTLDVCLKTLTEGSSNAQQIAAIKAEINEIIDFLDYPSDDGYVDCPVQITVPGVDVSQEEQNDLAKFLKPTHSKVKYQNWTGKDSLRDRFIHLATLLSRPQH